MTTTVMALGGFGRGDAGADARLDALRAALPDVELVAVSEDPMRTAEEHRCDVAPASLGAVAAAVRRADGVVVAGGDVLGDDPAGAADRRLVAAALVGARIRQIPSVLLGVGVAGRARRRVDSAVVRTGDLVVLRDRESASVLTARGVPAPLRVAADLAWRVVPPVTAETPADDTAAVVVDGRLGPAHAVDLARALRGVAGGVRVVPWRADARDVGFARMVAERCEAGVVTPAPARLVDVIDAIGDAGLVVTHRAHAAIAAAARGRRVLAVGTRPEVAGVARSVGQGHLPAHANRAVLGRAVARAAEGSPPDAGAVHDVVRRLDDAVALTRLVLGVDGPTADLGAHVLLERGAPVW